MARLNIKWDSRSEVAPSAASTGDAASNEAAQKRFAEKPMLIYVTSDDNTDAYSRKLEDICFPDERVAIGSKFFKCIKITTGNALQDRLLVKHGKSSPRLLLVTRDYKVLSVLEGKKISSGKLVKAMSHLVRKEYKNSFDSMVSGYAKLLNQLDRLEGEKALLADKTKRAEGSKAKLAKIARSTKDYEKDVKKWEASEKKLLAFKLNVVKKPKV
jgi:hypothetical protein